jgi:tetratricopeptide (TPR) repeat protein
MKMLRLGLALLASAALLAGGATARGEDGPEEEEGAAEEDAGDDAPAVAGAPSAEAARAEALFAAGRFAEAAPALRRVAGGEASDGEERRQIAEYHLAIALYRLRLPNASLAALSAIAGAPGHARHDEALPWLLKLAGDLPEPAGVMERIGKYGEGALSRFEGPGQRPTRDELAYWLGRDAYERRAYEEAADRFEEVSAKSPRHPRAQIFAGIARVRLRQTKRAIQAFRRVLDARGAPGDGEGPRLRDLARLSIGRTLYSASLHLGELGAPTIDETKLEAAGRSFGDIEPWSESWREGLFEQAWVYFMLGDYPRALGNLHSVDAPYFPGAPYLEADTLRGITSFVLCRYDEAAGIAARTIRRYGPVRARLAALVAALDREAGEADLVALLEDVRAGAAGVPPPLRPFVEAALSGRDLERHREHVRGLDEEAARLRRAPASLRASPLGAEVADTLSLARDLAVHDAGALVRDRLRRALGDLDKHLGDAKKLLVDVAEARRDPWRAPLAPGDEGPSAGLVLSADGYEIWPFDGEYWRDEVGHYQQVVTSRCRR